MQSHHWDYFWESLFEPQSSECVCVCSALVPRRVSRQPEGRGSIEHAPHVGDLADLPRGQLSAWQVGQVTGRKMVNMFEDAAVQRQDAPWYQD